MGYQCTIYAIEEDVLKTITDCDLFSAYTLGPEDEQKGFTVEDFEGGFIDRDSDMEVPNWPNPWIDPARLVIEQSHWGLDYLMSGKTEYQDEDFPLGFLTKTGTALFYFEDYNVRFFDPKEVVTINRFINGLDENTLRRNFDLDVLVSETYPFYRWRTMFDTEENVFPSLIEEFNELRMAVNRISNEGFSLVINIG